MFFFFNSELGRVRVGGYVKTLKSSSLCYGWLFILRFVIPTSVHPDSRPRNTSLLSMEGKESIR